MPIPEVDVPRVLHLYDAHRYRDAYDLTREAWRDPALVDDMSAEELIHAGRLASRLGNDKVRRWLFRLANARGPDIPLVRYYTGGQLRPRFSLYERLAFFEENNVPADADDTVRASWQASHAHLLAALRDFDGAHRRVAAAREVGVERVWVDYCEAEVLLAEDRWPEALAVAERAWRMSAGHPAVTSVLARCLAKLRGLADAVDVLRPQAATVQSYATVQVALWYMVALAERADAEDRVELGAEVTRIGERLFDLAPIADRETQTAIAIVRAEAALLTGDLERLRIEQDRLRTPFYATLLDNLAEADGGERRLLPFEHAFQKHDTCLPAAVAAVAGGLGLEIDADALSDTMTYGGTATWRVRDWLEERGYGARAFLVTPANVRRVLHAGLPFVLVTTGVSSSHATAAVGLDDATGTVSIHDPSSVRMDRVLVDKLHEDESPVGPFGLVITRSPEDPRLRLVPTESCDLADIALSYHKAHQTEGPRAASAVVEAALQRYPDHALTRRFDGLSALHMGQPRRAIAMQRRLLNLHPTCVILQRDLVDSLHATRDEGEIVPTLRRIVDRGFAPQFRAGAPWRYVPATYLARLADFVGMTQAGFSEAKRLLETAMAHEPFFADSYHIFGDVLTRQERDRDALLPLRLAATLDHVNEHFARAYADCLRLVGRQEDALRFLRTRVERLGDRLGGAEPWATLIDALSDYGEPGNATEAMEEAERTRPDDLWVAAFAIRFWIERGEWETARAALERLEDDNHRGRYLSAATQIARAEGDWRRGLELARAWLDETPDDLEAHETVLAMLAQVEGQKAAVEQARQWMESHPGDDHREHLWYELTRELQRTGEAERYLREKVERLPEDVWAWREIGHRLATDVETQSGQRREKTLRELQSTVDRCRGLAPEAAATRILEARNLAVRGEYAGGVAMLVEALARDPTVAWAYEYAWAWSEGLGTEQQRNLQAELEKRLLAGVGVSAVATQLAAQIAARSGVTEAEAALDRWQKARGDDPEIVLARARVWLDYGQGKLDAARAVEALEAALDRFPAKLPLRVELARAYGVAGREQEEVSALREVLRREPLHIDAASQLAAALARHGDEAAAARTLEMLVHKLPISAAAAGRLADLQQGLGRPLEALATFEAAIDRMPENIWLRERLIGGAAEIGHFDAAVAAARAAVDTFPDGAYCWALYAEALHASPAHADVVAREQAYRKALELNAELWRAADGLAVLLGEQRRFDEARGLLEPFVAVEPAPARARLAWIERVAGRRAGARASMLDVVLDHPSHRWALQQWMAWAEEDEAWEEVNAVLGEPPVWLSAEPELAARRLELLAGTGFPEEVIATDWERLLANFPGHEALNLMRFDQLWGSGDKRRATELLTVFEPYAPESPYLLARKVAVKVEAGQPEEAVDLAARVWTMPGDEQRWPEQQAWAMLDAGDLAKRGVEKLDEIIRSGARVRIQALRAGLERAVEVETRPALVLEGWLSRLAEATWPAGMHLGAVLETLDAMGAARTARAFWRANEDVCNRLTGAWMAIGAILSTGHQEDTTRLRDWMADWRDRPDVQMWSLVAYSLGLREQRIGAWHLVEDIEELHDTSRDALERLPHDHTARYHATTLLETSVRRRRDGELRDYAARYGGLLADDGFNAWMPDGWGTIPRLLLLFSELVATDDVATVRVLNDRLVALRVPKWVGWVAPEWSGRLQGKTGFFGRLWLRIRLWASRA